MTYFYHFKRKQEKIRTRKNELFSIRTNFLDSFESITSISYKFRTVLGYEFMVEGKSWNFFVLSQPRESREKDVFFF